MTPHQFHEAVIRFQGTTLNESQFLEARDTIENAYRYRGIQSVGFNGDTNAFTAKERDDINNHSVGNLPANRDIPADEALIRAREAVIAAQYVTGLDAEQQIRAGQHDDWLVLKIAHHALMTKDLDLDVLRKYHAPGQLAHVKPQPQVIVQRERRSPWNILIVRLARHLGKFRQNNYSERDDFQTRLNQRRKQMKIDFEKQEEKYREKMKLIRKK